MKTNYNETGFVSETMNRFMGKLDYQLYDMEQTIKEQALEIERLEKENMKYLDKSLQDSWETVGNVFNAILSTPKLDLLSATILSKIKDMNSLEEIRNYIDDVFEANKEMV